MVPARPWLELASRSGIDEAELPNLLGPELVGWLVKIRRELADDSDVGFCGTMGIITTLEFLQHFLA
jgi:hypothetical protein